MDLSELLPKEQIISIKSAEKQLVIKELISKLHELGKLDNADRYYTQVMHRETLENTGVGNGFAIPHVRTDSVKKLLTIIGVCTEPVDYDSFDKQPVKYVMLSIFPTSLSTKYLYLVGMMARIFSNSAKRLKIDEARTPSKIYPLLTKEAKVYFDSLTEINKDDHQIESLTGVPSSDLDLLIRLDQLYRLLDSGDASEALSKKINELRKYVDNRSLSYYERMRKKCQNPFSILEKNACGGCHMVIPPVEMAKFKSKKTLGVCTYCGRFLILV